jgi:hypothetical protein
MKLIDLLENMELPRCKHCSTYFRYGTGEHLITCQHPNNLDRNQTSGEIVGSILQREGEVCLPEDWARCPLNPANKNNKEPEV